MSTACGPGSTDIATQGLRDWLKIIIKKYDIKTINDVGCGDLYWITLDDYAVDYVGYDDLIRSAAKERLPEGWQLEQLDARNAPMRECDLSICKDVLRHNSEEGIEAILAAIIASSRYLLADYDDSHHNTGTHHRQLADGESYLLPGNKTDLRKWLGEPMDSIHSVDKRFGLWLCATF